MRIWHLSDFKSNKQIKIIWNTSLSNSVSWRNSSSKTKRNRDSANNSNHLAQARTKVMAWQMVDTRVNNRAKCFITSPPKTKICICISSNSNNNRCIINKCSPRCRWTTDIRIVTVQTLIRVRTTETLMMTNKTIKMQVNKDSCTQAWIWTNKKLITTWCRRAVIISWETQPTVRIGTNTTRTTWTINISSTHTWASKLKMMQITIRWCSTLWTWILRLLFLDSKKMAAQTDKADRKIGPKWPRATTTN